MGTIYKTFDVALELKQTSTNAPFYVIEGDNGNKIRITVTDGGSAVDLTGCRVIAVFSKSNGTSMQDSAEADGGVTIGGTYNNEVTVALRPASIAPGQVECELQIYSDENKTTLVTTAKFNFECQRAIFNEDTAMATNEYPLLVSLISVCNGIVEAEELRVTAEASRVSAEGERAAAEASRVSAEQARASAESGRASAESARANAESSRVTAEQGRVSAENTRVSQEQERQAEILKIAGMTVEVTTLAAGAQATAELVESGGHKVLKLGIPKGETGATGHAGVGVPEGGAAGQLLGKTESGTEWVDPPQSGVQSDWNQNDDTQPDYVKNRPFYTGDPVDTVLLEETTATFSDRNGLYSAEISADFSLEIGTTYKVSWDGTIYECVGTDLDGPVSVVALGNLSIINKGEDTGEPFFYVHGQIITADTSASHTISISGIVVPITKIDEKYIPELPYMDKVNPTGTGSFSLNRKADTTIGRYSFAEGIETTASGNSSHAEGYITIASGNFSHAEGSYTTASGDISHAEGYSTTASSKNQHVQGKYNVEDSSDTYAHIVGNGTSDTARSNAHTLDWSGNAWYAGTVEGTALILPSSTAASTKKFKITVDDSGTLTTTDDNGETCGYGTGDMSKSVYDTNGNGVVDNAEKLGGHAASYFSPATHNHAGVYQPAGTYATPSDISAAVSGHNSNASAHSEQFDKKQNIPTQLTALPDSGTALTANTIYAVADTVGTYAFTPPESGWAHGTFTTGTSVSVSFTGTFVGTAPTIEASKIYEFDVFDGVWAVQEVVSA